MTANPAGDEVNNPPKDGEGEKPAAQTEFTPINSQEELERRLSKRLTREREKFADVHELREKAAKFDEAQEAAKSELERATERATALEQKLAKAERERLRADLAGPSGVPVNMVTGETEDEMKASIQTAIEFREAAQAPRPPRPDHRQGDQGGSASTTADQFAAVLGQQFQK